MGIGGLLNSAANIGGALGNESHGKGTSLNDFLATLSKHGVQIASNYEVEYSGFDGLEFFIQDFTVPGLKSNTGQIYYKGHAIQVPVNSENEHEFSMTVICDADGIIYTKMRNAFLNFYQDSYQRKKIKAEKKEAKKQFKIQKADGQTPDKSSLKSKVTVNPRTIDNTQTIKIRARGDGTNNSGMKIILRGIRFTSVGGLSFGNTRNEIVTFSVQGYANEVSIQRTKTKTSSGILGGLDKASSAIGNVLG